MLVKVKFRSEQKYVKVSHSDLKLSDFLDEAFVKFGISVSNRPEARLYDESGTEIDEDVFEDILKQPNLGVFQILLPDSSNELTHVPPVPSEESSAEISSNESDDTILLSDDSPTRKRRAEDEAGIMVKKILQTKPGGDGIIREYNKTKCLSDSNRRKMVNILTADMTEKHSSSPPKQVRELYAQGIIAMFPYLRDPYAKLGYEHYYDPQSGQGYLSWKIKNIQRNSAPLETRRCVPQSFSGGPSAQREASSSTEVILTEEQYREAVSLMMHTSEEATVKVKMRETFQYRRKIIHDPSRCTDVLTEFPRYLDIKGLIELDFACLFGKKTAAKFLERWPTTFMQKVIQQSKGLNSSQELQDLIHCAESAVDTESDEDAQGRKRPGKMSASQAEKYIVIFKKAGTNIQEHLDSIKESTQPYLLAVGTKKSSIHGYYIILDKKAIPCKSVSGLAAFDELFKAHFVFGASYNKVLHNMYTFIQTTFNHDRIVLGPGKTVSLCDLSENDQIASKLNIPPQTYVLSVKWVKHNGTEYRSGLIICGEVDIDLPVFYKIKDIVVRNEFVVLVASPLKTVCFDDHRYAYRIEPRH
ncbi:uncharacterized protein LOC120522481 isoform X2 [Polypterus senegalus]|uniref:uncharacterized protein LOC120522481 isoform X2 n=1 Tax=Polypterus senegalus TaxID=55291 RepID=UPI001963839C|nr:uncharacterized protein LOC120522481 isoform X2 [Polypterus senegalus]